MEITTVCGGCVHALAFRMPVPVIGVGHSSVNLKMNKVYESGQTFLDSCRFAKVMLAAVGVYKFY
jgi:hypothetical protein